MGARAVRAGALLLVVLALFACGSEASITAVKVSHDDRPRIFLTRPFGFLAGGTIDITLKNDQIFLPEGTKPESINKERMGVAITNAEMDADLQAGGSTCALDSRAVSVLFTFAEVDRGVANPDGSYHTTSTFNAERAGEYSLVFINCEPVVVTFDAHIEFYNVNAKDVKNYLSAGEAPLPILYIVFTVAFGLLGGFWVYLCVMANPPPLKIHWMMLALIVMKTLTLMTQAGMYDFIRRTGSPDGWNIAFYIFTFMRGIMLFVVIVLIGTGWSFIKPFLSDREKRIMMIVVPLQVFANVATIVLDETSPATKGWLSWRDLFHLVDIICCCAILFPIVWSIKQLREAAHTDGKAARNVVKLTLFRQFYVMVVSYIYFTRIVVYLLKSTTPYQYEWVADMAGELATLAFYVATGYKFQPQQDNPYFALDEEEEAARAKLDAEEGDL